jgi:hypothetical protein
VQCSALQILTIASAAQVACIDENKKVVGEGTSGCTNFNSVGQEKASHHLREAITSALKAAGVPEDQGACDRCPRCCCCSLMTPALLVTNSRWDLLEHERCRPAGR